MQQNLSIRQLAEAVNVSKTTLVQVEQGRTSRRSSYLKVAEYFGLHLENLLAPEASSEQSYQVHQRQDDRWFNLAAFDKGPLSDLAQTDARERGREAVLYGQAPLNILSSRLPHGRIKPTVIEVFAPTPERAHAGEEHVFVLEGDAVVSVGGCQVMLAEGESITFWSAERHSYAPQECSRLPVRLLSVRVDV